VISKHPAGIAVVDAGMASMSTAHGEPRLRKPHGARLYQIHAENSLIKPDSSGDVKVGDKVEFFTSYLDQTMLLHERVYAIRNGEVEAIWEIQGRNAST
jgi:D-serine deaminase-like pyridoxal phosphate-dependent protein